MDNNIQELIDRLTKSGYTLCLTSKTDGAVEASICHRTWVTDNLYQARPLPTWWANAVSDLIPGIVAFLDQYA